MQVEQQNERIDASEAAAIIELDDIVATLLVSGWCPTRESAFQTAVLMRLSDISASGARQLFYDAARRIQ
jgi:hypothetical protein